KPGFSVVVVMVPKYAEARFLQQLKAITANDPKADSLFVLKGEHDQVQEDRKQTQSSRLQTYIVPDSLNDIAANSKPGGGGRSPASLDLPEKTLDSAGTYITYGSSAGFGAGFMIEHGVGAGVAATIMSGALNYLYTKTNVFQKEIDVSGAAA